MPGTIITRLLRFVPLNLISALTGVLASATRPKSVVRAAIRLFQRAYRIDLSDAIRQLEEYHSLDDFFTRALREDARPIGDGFVAPADSVLTEHGVVERGTLIQAKGKTYPLGRFLGSESLAASFDGGYFMTFYLAPPDYHRVHAPCAGIVRELRHIPGRLWPVNRAAVEHVPQLFCENERLVFLLQTQHGTVALVMVGALNVGSIGTPFSDLRTNGFAALRRRAPSSVLFAEPRHVEPGEWCGTFHLGSSVVLVLPREVFRPDLAKCGTRVRVGETIGELLRKS